MPTALSLESAMIEQKNDIIFHFMVLFVAKPHLQEEDAQVKRT